MRSRALPTESQTQLRNVSPGMGIDGPEAALAALKLRPNNLYVFITRDVSGQREGQQSRSVGAPSLGGSYRHNILRFQKIEDKRPVGAF
jgi:hypothetical protein